MTKYLVTAALPYGNGPLHFGHLAGVYLPADIFSRHMKLMGEELIYVSGSDEHGVAIMQNAQKAGIGYKEYVDQWHQDHKSLFDKFDIEFDVFGQTSAEYHREETLKWFEILYEKGAIEKQDEKQLQCQDCKNLLPDRFVEGECYECGYENARGDECPKCGTWIDPLKLKNPQCKFCDSKNIKAIDSFQWYLMLSKYQKEFDSWFETKSSWKKTVFPYVKSLASEGLVNRAITRDLDWGIDVPLDEAEGKKLYVWFDAPIGYVSNTKKLFEGTDTDYLNDWWLNKDTKLVHFIGKDNIIFHSIIFPVMSLVSERAKLVDDLPANQYLNLSGAQFSKSSGNSLDSHQAIDKFGSDALRFYLASLIPEMQDSNFTWSGLEVKVNNELANNIGNFINRCLKFYVKNYPEGINLTEKYDFFETELFTEFEKLRVEYQNSLKDYQFQKAIKALMGIGFSANQYFSDREPWSKIKEDVPHAEVTLYTSVILVYLIGIHFSSLLPKLSHEIRAHFEEGLQNENFYQKIYQGEYEELKSYLNSNPLKIIKKPKGLVPKIDPDIIKDLEG